MAKARRIPGLEADEPYGVAAARIVDVRVAELMEHARGVLDVDDIERVHDMRVATRRLRAALEIFGPCFPRRELKAALEENAARIVAVRLEELRSFVPAALDPANSIAQHDMRIAAKRLRYILESTGFCFGTWDRLERTVSRKLNETRSATRPSAWRAAAELAAAHRSDPPCTGCRRPFRRKY